MQAKWKRMWNYLDSQEVGLEAATLQRVRNSSLVKWFCADNSRGLSLVPKLRTSPSGGVVGEHSLGGEARPTRSSGAQERENAGMSSERKARTLPAVSLRFPEQC